MLPSSSISFVDCVVGDMKEVTIRLRNDSPDLPLCFAIRRVAHFHTRHSCGYIEPLHVKDLIVYFQPNQIGLFKCKLLLDVIGQVCTLNPLKAPIHKKKVIETHGISVKGCSPSVVGIKGNYSQSAKKSRMFQSTDNIQPHMSTSVEGFHSQDIQSSHSSLPSVKECKIKEEDIPIYIAHPNDLAGSIRPSNPKECVRYLLFFLNPTYFLNLNCIIVLDQKYRDHLQNLFLILSKFKRIR